MIEKLKNLDTTNLSLNDFTESIQLDDVAINLDDIPWVSNNGIFMFKPVRFDLTTGTWTNLVKIKPHGTVGRHRHTGGQVFAHTLQGQWRYKERDWVATAGSIIFEPPGDIHTLVVDGEEDMITLFTISGSVQHLNDNDEVTYQDDIFARIKLYVEHCKKNDLPILNLFY
ncbi:2,4'-dihydroxyacetophenone dioxygenase family protein [Psychrobacillus sp. OK032]|uniref:2,4'-dihydroxyacetophenone dioxygenase family protein n=1 Tax=Psychrobacillus sp. OK032 TaxID=1884358 RepID=UPI0008BA2B91|nr:2,4'-dihydroxyacetophenone dioxygenase family protein [Psychrobacillus sp. OK032]SER69845.1 ChrR Cupin-like domain-containing protein [Psychrobacillus sp. OK032]